MSGPFGLNCACCFGSIDLSTGIQLILNSGQGRIVQQGQAEATVCNLRHDIKRFASSQTHFSLSPSNARSSARAAGDKRSPLRLTYLSSGLFERSGAVSIPSHKARLSSVRRGLFEKFGVAGSLRHPVSLTISSWGLFEKSSVVASLPHLLRSIDVRCVRRRKSGAIVRFLLRLMQLNLTEVLVPTGG